MSSLEVTEKECAANAVAPRVRLQDIEGAIEARYSFTAGKAIEAMGMPSVAGLSLLTVCVIVMKNGFVIVGKSAPASPENFNEERGRKLAYEDAVRQIWPLMGFALRDKLSGQ